MHYPLDRIIYNGPFDQLWPVQGDKYAFTEINFTSIFHA